MRKLSKGKWLAVVLALALVLSLVPAMGFADNDCEPCEPWKEVDLIAGQHNVVGTVTVTNDEDQICVTYALDEDALDEGWRIYETHLAIATELDGIPQTRANRWGTNPIPGQFQFGDDELDGVEEWEFCISFDKLGFGICEEVYIAAHAVVERIVEEAYCEIISGEITPDLSWMRSSESEVANFPGKGTQWDPETQGFTIPLDSDEVVWDGGSIDQNVMDDTTPSGRWPGYNPDISYATYIYAYNDGGNHDGQADLRRFQATFDVDIPEGSDVTGGKLGSVNEGYEDMIPINDNIYIFVNEDLLFWGGTIPDAETIEFAGMFGKQAVRGGTSPDWDPVETDGWNIPGTIPDIDAAEFGDGVNYLDVFAEEYSIFGAMHELYLTLEYEFEECYPEVREDETAWGDGDRFNVRGNWGMFFEYKICDPPPDEEIYPESGTVTVAYEDLPIGDSDWDYNDWVATIETEGTFQSVGGDRYLTKMEFDITPKARGAMAEHEFTIVIPADTFSVNGEYTVAYFDSEGNELESRTAPFFSSAKIGYVMWDQTSAVLPDMSNTDPTEPYIDPSQTAKFSIEFDGDGCGDFDFGDYPEADIGIHGEGMFFEPYIESDMDPYVEIGVGDIRMLVVPDDWRWPREQIPIWRAYDDVGEDAGQPTFVDGWWDLGFDDDLVY